MFLTSAKIRSLAGAVVLGALCISPAVARDEIFQVGISDAMASPAAHEKLDGSVRFYFGDASHPRVLQRFGDYVTNQKTSSFLKSDARACNWVFVSALIELQRRANKLGANAVVNIHSYYKKEAVSSTTEVPCHAGGMIAGIALKGDFVNVAQ